MSGQARGAGGDGAGQHQAFLAGRPVHPGVRQVGIEEVVAIEVGRTEVNTAEVVADEIRAFVEAGDFDQGGEGGRSAAKS